MTGARLTPIQKVRTVSAVAAVRQREDMREELRIFATAPGGVIGRGAEDEARMLSDAEREALIEELKPRRREPGPTRSRRLG